jgi:hypothetical protein
MAVLRLWRHSTALIGVCQPSIPASQSEKPFLSAQVNPIAHQGRCGENALTKVRLMENLGVVATRFYDRDLAGK